MDNYEHALQNLFFSYSGTTHEVNERTFIKVFQEAHVLDSDLSKDDLHLFFNKVKGQGQIKIGYEQFRTIVGLAAAKKKIPLAVFESILSKSHGPKCRGTTPERVRFHDDKNTYTGVYGRGGPKTVDTSKVVSDLANLVNRKEADVRGVVHNE